MYRISDNLPQLEYDGFRFKLEFCEPSAFAKEVARAELRETPENVENGLKELRRLLQDEPKLDCPIDNDLWLLSFLRPAHFYVEEARTMMRNYFNYRQKYPELFSGLRLETIKEILHDFTGSTLPQRDQCGRRLYVVLSGKYWDTNKFDKELFLKAFFVQCEYLRCEPETQICGIVILLDMLDLSLRQALLYTPNFLKRLVDFIQDGMGIRFKGYHILNQPQLFNMVFALAKPFIKEKFGQRVHFHGKNMSSLHRHISPDCLPACYGGTLKASPSYGPQFYGLFEKYEKDYVRFMQYGYK